MLKSLFESSIDKLHISADMKDAIKKINNVCLEAEGQENDPSKQYNYEAYPEGKSIMKEDSDKRVAAQKKDAEAKKNGQEKDTSVKGVNPDVEKTAKNGWNYDVSEDIKNAKTKPDPSTQYNYEAYPQGKSIMKEDSDERVAAQKKDAEAKKNGQEKDTSVKGVDPDVEKTAKNGWNYDVSEDMKKNDKEDEKPAKEEKEEKKDSKKEDKEESKEEGKEEDAKEEQPAETSEPEENKGTQIAKGATREPSQVRTSGPASSEPNPANAQATPKAAPKFRADVATVQFFIRATNPQTNLVGDGILGPKTIAAIQQTANIQPTGKMDQKTQAAFNKLLAEAKQKVIPVQQQLGVTADGLIGKQTLTAMQKANMNVANVFGASQGTQTQVANNQGGNANNAAPQQAQPQQQAQNVTSIKFNEAQAQQFLKNKTISQQEYNIWKQYGIAPIFQRQNPQGTQTQIAAMQQKQKEVNTGAPVGKSVTSIPFNEAQAQQQLKSNQIKQQEYNIWKQYGIAPIFQRKNPQGTQAQIAKVQQGNKQQPQQAAQPAQQQQQAAQPAQPQQQAQQQQAPQQQQAQQQPQNPKQPQGSTQYLSGNISYMNLPPDEKKVYDDAEKKAQAEYLKKGNNEQTAYTKAQMNAQVAVLRYRQKKGKKG